MDKGKIIVVEDDIELLETFAEYLTLKGFYVECATCALDFFQALVGSEFDVAVVDLGLPDKSGLEVVEHLRRNTSLGIIILTARDSMSDKMRGYKAGADHYFTKPFDLRELAAVAESLINRLGDAASISPGKDDSWRLDPLRRILATPTGHAIKLTEKENDFLKMIMPANGDTVDKDALLEALAYQADATYGARALAVMVTRLRKKIREQTGLEPPITAARAQGYSFSAPAELA